MTELQPDLRDGLARLILSPRWPATEKLVAAYLALHLAPGGVVRAPVTELAAGLDVPEARITLALDALVRAGVVCEGRYV